MTLRDQLKIIQKLSGLTQTELANRLGVTFAAFNRWINEKSIPRRKQLKAIDNLYKEYSGEKQIPKTALQAKKQFVLKIGLKHKNVIKEILENPDIQDQFYLSLTYNSNRIEGSTLSEGETAIILFQKTALPNKSLIEQLEAKNHQTALIYLFKYLMEKKALNENLILKLHGVLMNSIKSDAGIYRNHGVRILGTHIPTANYLKIPNLMEELIKDINRKKNDAISHIANIHARFEKIHPFSDGNGRIGRLLMHAMAIKANFAPAVVLQEKKQLYAVYLNKAQTKDDQSLLEDFICDATLEGYRILERR